MIFKVKRKKILSNRSKKKKKKKKYSQTTEIKKNTLKPHKWKFSENKQTLTVRERLAANVNTQEKLGLVNKFMTM